MLEFFTDLGLFFFKSVIVVVAFLIIIGFIASIRASKKASAGSVELTNISSQLQKQHQHLMAELLDKKSLKKWLKKENHDEKQKKKETKAKKQERQKAKAFVIDFHGDIKASRTKALSREITALLQMADKKDEVILRLESAGGLVHGYGLASSQLQRLKEHNIPLTVCIDKVAASGGYMMACVADTICAAPFAIVGSIGVVAQLPNFHRLLKNWNVDVEQHTAGKYKRTLTLIGKNTEEGRKKFKQDMQVVHNLFKTLVQTHRPQLAINKVATGEIWYGQQAINLNMIDEVITSDEYIYALSRKKAIYHIQYKEKKTFAEKMGVNATALVEKFIVSLWQKNQEQQATKGR